jgi:hypothetical protein
MEGPESWAPESCTLPQPDRPMRVAEFDDLFAIALRSDRLAPTRLEIVLPDTAESTARDLADRETQCCSFFAFDFEPLGDNVVMRIGVSPSRTEVLDSLEARFAS